MAAGSNLTLYLYLHTHWDREWYWAYERYRTQLLTVMRLVVEGLEKGELPNFHLDGQACALEDFLELEPTYEGRIKKLIAGKKLLVGPWYVLADQMLVSGESLLRNMEFGIDRSTRYGAAMMVGYCPDTFGHTQDMPRILKGFGIDNAVVWRGVPELDQGPQIFWRSPDGSEVVATVLARGYHQTLFHEAEGSCEPERIDRVVENLLPWLGFKFDPEAENVSETDEPSPVFTKEMLSALVPVGGDHQKPPSKLDRVLDSVEKRVTQLLKKHGAGTGVDTIALKPVQLPEFLKSVSQAVRKPAVPVRLIEGELRTNEGALKHCAGYMLPGVLSTRLYLKRANRIAEHRLIKISEPLHAMMSMLGLTRYPAVEMQNVWKYLLKNHPHDSMCGCSVDAVHREMITRFASIEQILDVLEQRVRQDLLAPGAHEWSHDRAKQAKGKDGLENAGFGRGNVNLADPDVPLSGMAVFNLSSQEASAPVPVSLAIPSRYIEACSGETWTAAKRYLSDVLGDENSYQISSVGFDTELFGESGGVPLYKDLNYLEGWLWAEGVPGFGLQKIEFETESNGVPSLASAAAVASTKSVSSAVASSNKPSRGVESGAKRVPEGGIKPGAGSKPVSTTDSNLSNEFFEVHVDGSGSLSVDVLVGDAVQKHVINHRLQDVADAGDSYNFDPVMDDAPLVAGFVSCSGGEKGPLIGSLKLKYRIEMPRCVVEDENGKSWAHLEGGNQLVNFKRSSEKIEHEIETVVTLKKGVPIVFFDTTWFNKSEDHRLEVLFDTGAPVKETYSENHMSLVQRKCSAAEIELPVEKYTEAPLDRFPAQRFFIANGQAYFNLGLPEYGVDGKNVSITLLRAISMLSRRRLMTRGGGAGPYMPVPEGNCLGENRVSYGWAPLAVLESEPAKRSSEKIGQLTGEQIARAYRLAESFEGCLWTSPFTPQSINEINPGSLVSIDNECIRCAAFYSRDGGESLTLRLLNVSPGREVATIKLAQPKLKIERVDLNGKKFGAPLKEENGVYKVEFGNNELVTLSIRRN